MMRPFQRFLPLLALTACGKGCENQGPELPPRPDVPVSRPADPNLLPVERALDLRLPDRRGGSILPGLSLLPFRRLPNFDLDKNMVARLDAHSLKVLEREAKDERLNVDENVLTTLRLGAQDYRERAGLEPNRLVLVVDAGTPMEVTGRIRQLALRAAQWRVVALARDGDQLVELSLVPPPERRPLLPAPPTPTN